ncbi:MAG: hypothetical protein ACLVKO_09115 [Dysgonomonas sp.]
MNDRTINNTTEDKLKAMVKQFLIVLLLLLAVMAANAYYARKLQKAYPPVSPEETGSKGIEYHRIDGYVIPIR